MDAVKFLKEYDRMCGLYSEERCEGCPLQNDICAFYPLDGLDNIVQVVEKWSAEHPVKTRLMDFLEKHPHAVLDRNGVPLSNPCFCGYCGKEADVYTCNHCEHTDEPLDFCWNLPLEDEA